MVIQAVYRVHNLVITVLGRFWRSIGLNSSGPAALSFPKEWKACFIRVSFIQGIPCMGIGGVFGMFGGLEELSGKCSSVRVMRVSFVLAVSEPSGFFT